MFLLKPGQTLYILKGCLHAFQKLSSCKLPESGCHAELRNQYISETNLGVEDICISIAWDWVWTGHSAQTVQTELACISEAVELASKIPEVAVVPVNLCLFRLMKKLKESLGLFLWDIASKAELVKGVQPDFERLLNSEIQIVEAGRNFGSQDQRVDTSVKKEDASARYTCDRCKCIIFNHFWAVRRKADVKQEYCNACILSVTNAK